MLLNNQRTEVKIDRSENGLGSPMLYNLLTWFLQFLKLTVLEALRVVPMCRISSNRDVNTPHSVTAAMSLLEDGICCGEMLAALLLC
jgi:hypothetical protein